MRYSGAKNWPWCVDYQVTQISPKDSTSVSARALSAAPAACSVTTGVRPAGGSSATIAMDGGQPDPRPP